MLRNAIAFMTLSAICACRPANHADPTAVRHVIDSLNAKLVTWYSTGQADSAADVFAQDVWVMPPNNAPIIGRDSVLSYQRQVFSTGKWQFELKTDDVIGADSIAVERGHYTLRVTAGPQARYPSFEDRGNYVSLWRRESDGHWRTVWDAKVSTVPLPLPPKPSSVPAKKPG